MPLNLSFPNCIKIHLPRYVLCAKNAYLLSCQLLTYIWGLSSLQNAYELRNRLLNVSWGLSSLYQMTYDLSSQYLKCFLRAQHSSSNGVRAQQSISKMLLEGSNPLWRNHTHVRLKKRIKEIIESDKLKEIKNSNHHGTT